MASTYRMRLWRHGLFAAGINGFSSGGLLVMVDPHDFNIFDGGAAKLFGSMAAFAVFGLLTYMKEHPLPDPEKDIDAVSEVREQIAELKQAGTGNGTIPTIVPFDKKEGGN